MLLLAVSVKKTSTLMGNLFNKYFINDFISAYSKSLVERIDKLEITDSTEITSLINNLKNEFTISPITIGEPRPSEPKETTIQRQTDRGERYPQKVFEIYVTIPFTGTRDLFYCMPSTSTVVYLDKRTTINNNNITSTIVLDNLEGNVYFSQVNTIISTLKTNLPQVHAETKPWNDNLETFIKNSLEKRKDIVSKKFDFMEKIGLKVNPKSTEFLVPPTVIKKVIPKPVTETTKTGLINNLRC
jgi:hypothetical protein